MGRLMDVDALIEKYGDWYVEEGPEIGFIGTLKNLIEMQPNVGGWISVEDDLPKQHKSIFAPWYGTEMWNAAMWKEESDTVIVAGRFPDGTKTTTTGKLCDGKWITRVSKVLNCVVTHWMPMPELPKEEDKNVDDG